MANNARGTGSNNKRGWPSARSRGVASGFRNFCITNDHPDGIIYETDDDISDTERSNLSTNDNQKDQENQPGPSEQISVASPISSSSSVISCSPIPSSEVSGSDSIKLTSDDDDDSSFSDSDLSQKQKKISDPEKDANHQHQDGFSNDSDDNLVIVSDECDTPKGSPSPKPSTSSFMKSENIGVVTPLPTTAIQPVASNKEDEAPQFLRHKKFNYKTRTAVVASEGLVSNEEPKRIVDARNPTTQQPAAATGTKANVLQLNVDDLRLSPYITREQAEARLRAIGNLEETQNEIDNFAAIICTGEMFRMQMSAGKSQQSDESTHSSTFAQRKSTEMQPSSSTTLQGRTPYLIASNTVTACNSSSNASEQNKNLTSETEVKNGRGYIQITAPSQSSHANDDYEWISD